jgi:hypothetical protein
MYFRFVDTCYCSESRKGEGGDRKVQNFGEFCDIRRNYKSLPRKFRLQRNSKEDTSVNTLARSITEKMHIKENIFSCVGVEEGGEE